MIKILLSLCLLGMPSEGILDVAKSYLGVPYVAGTLETDGAERLIINEDSVDCTTFVELSVARWLAMQGDEPDFAEQVRRMRYRGGVVDGYLSRLHYFTDWVAENTRRGIWRELTPEDDNHLWVTDTLELSFMSEHPQSYPYLKANAWAVDSIRAIEQRYASYPIRYINKEHLNLTQAELPIRDGDVLALVTTIEGLDVTHLGFAVWKGETLHLMHASMTHGKVVMDERPLYEYLKSRKHCPGIRVIRLERF
ncbi:MAG: DUF1460 domain-containing protein [Bacteroidaceae bacterium]|nr:DUF1460 domain-containing protein [Bacteroidaceae bacterium]